MQEAAAERIEIDLLLNGIERRYGYDFRNYSFASLKRRMEHGREQLGVKRYSEVIDLVLHDPGCFDIFLRSLSITVTEMFRDPDFYAAVRETVVPILKTYPFVKIWHAGCATGEEVYSLAIVLHEEGFLGRARLYGTDFNKHSLDIAEKGVYAAKDIETFAANYRAAGGRRNFAEYFHSGYGLAKINDFLRERVTFSYHNLVTDGVFGEMNLVSCRNVLIYFDKTLQDRALNLFADSLRHGGILCLGSKESLSYSNAIGRFEPLVARQRVYKKSGGGNV